jgi:hypothetical protein
MSTDHPQQAYVASRATPKGRRFFTEATPVRRLPQSEVTRRLRAVKLTLEGRDHAVPTSLQRSAIAFMTINTRDLVEMTLLNAGLEIRKRPAA